MYGILWLKKMDDQSSSISSAVSLKRCFEAYTPYYMRLKPRSHNTSLRKCYNEENYDVCFVRQNEEPIKAHMAVLSTVSNTLLNNSRKTRRKQTNCKQFRIPKHYSYNTFSMIIDFIYGEEVALAEAGDIVTLYEAAISYQLASLIDDIAGLVTTWKYRAVIESWLPIIVELCGMASRHRDNVVDQGLVFQAAIELIIAKIDSFSNICQYHFLALPKEAICKIAQSEDVRLEEIDLFTLLNEWSTYNEDETPLTHVRYGLISHHDLSFKVADKKYKDNVGFSVALQQHHLFNKEAVKNDPKQFSMRYKQKGVQPFFPLTKTTFTYCTSDSSTAQFNNVQSVGMIMSRQMVCRPTTIVFPESMIVQQMYSLSGSAYIYHPANMYVILTCM